MALCDGPSVLCSAQGFKTQADSKQGACVLEVTRQSLRVAVSSSVSAVFVHGLVLHKGVKSGLQQPTSSGVEVSQVLTAASVC